MKKTLTLLLISMALYGNAQYTIKETDMDALVEISEMYSKTVHTPDAAFYERLEMLRTPVLENLINTVIAISKHDTSIFNPKYLKKPSKKDLYMWYVIRQIHINRQKDNPKPKQNIEVAKEYMNKPIESRCLVDNYYYQIRSSITYLFNTANLSNINMILDTLEIKNKTDRAIFFINIVEACAQRFIVMNSTKNNKLLLEYAVRMPKINGMEYYYFTDFNYADFDWLNYRNIESYNTRHIGNYLNILLAHYNAIKEQRKDKSWQTVYHNSILNMPEYFHYSNNPNFLNELYTKQGKKVKKTPKKKT